MGRIVNAIQWVVNASTGEITGYRRKIDGVERAYALSMPDGGETLAGAVVSPTPLWVVNDSTGVLEGYRRSVGGIDVENAVSASTEGPLSGQIVLGVQWLASSSTGKIVGYRVLNANGSVTDRQVNLEALGGVVTNGLVAALDAKLYASGQTWANAVATPADGSAQTAYDYFLGTTSASQASDPTITNAGADNAYWLFDQTELFTETLSAAAMPAFLRTMHHAGKKWTIEIWMQWPGVVLSNNHPVFDSGTSDQGGSDMSRGVMFADLGNGADGLSGRLKFRVKRDSSAVSAWVRNSDANLPSGSVQMVAVSWDATGTEPSFMYRNGNYEASSGDGSAGNTWTVTGATFGTLDAANSARIGARGDGNFCVPNGTRVYLLRVYNRNLSKVELDSNWLGNKARFGL